MEYRKIGKYVTPAFFVMLAVSTAMWLLTQLGKDYNGVAIPVEVTANGVVFDVECYASGSGYKLAGHRLFGKTKVSAVLGELGVTPSPMNESWGVVDPAALTAIIASRVNDVKVESVGEVPEIPLEGIGI